MRRRDLVTALAAVGAAAAAQTLRPRSRFRPRRPADAEYGRDAGVLPGLGFDVAEGALACSGLHRRSDDQFSSPRHLAARTVHPACPRFAKPPCGDLCFVWDGTPDALKAMLDQCAGAKNLAHRQAPVARHKGGRRKSPSERLHPRPRRQPPRVRDLLDAPIEKHYADARRDRCLFLSDAQLLPLFGPPADGTRIPAAAGPTGL